MELLLKILVPTWFVAQGLHDVINAESVNAKRFGGRQGARGVRIVGVGSICVGVLLAALFLRMN